MKNSNNTEKKKGPGVLDVIIILALAACIVAGGFAYVYSEATAETVATENDMEEYVVSFEVYGLRQSYVNMISVGDVFYTSSSDDFGVLNEDLIITPAVVYVEDENGKYVKTYAPENGDYTKVDLSGSFTVKGVRDSKGFFLLNGKTKLVPNDGMIIRKDSLSVSVSITAIEKVSG